MQKLTALAVAAATFITTPNSHAQEQKQLAIVFSISDKPLPQLPEGEPSWANKFDTVVCGKLYNEPNMLNNMSDEQLAVRIQSFCTGNTMKWRQVDNADRETFEAFRKEQNGKLLKYNDYSKTQVHKDLMQALRDDIESRFQRDLSNVRYELR